MTLSAAGWSSLVPVLSPHQLCLEVSSPVHHKCGLSALPAAAASRYGSSLGFHHRASPCQGCSRLTWSYCPISPGLLQVAHWLGKPQWLSPCSALKCCPNNCHTDVQMAQSTQEHTVFLFGVLAPKLSLQRCVFVSFIKAKTSWKAKWSLLTCVAHGLS